VVGCIVEGCSNRDIAKQFNLSEETVKRHLSNIFDKTGVSTRLELALFAIAHQLVAAPLTQKLTMIIQQNAAVAGKPAPQINITSATPIQLPAALGQCGRFIADINGAQGQMKIMGVLCSLPLDSGGAYKNIMLMAQAPAAVAAQSAPTAQAIFQSYRIPTAWLQKKLTPHTAPPPPPARAAASAAMMNSSTILGEAGADNSANCFDLAVLRETPTYQLPRILGTLGWQQLVKTSLEQCQRSFGVECSDRIEAHGAQRRDVTGGDGDGGEHGGDAGEGGEIVGRDAVKQAGHEMRNNKRANQAHAGAGGGQSEALAQNHLEDIAPLRAQREANGDLARLLIDQEGDGSVDSKPGEQQGSCGKQRHHFHGEPPHGKRRGENVVQGLRAEDGKLRIDGLDLLRTCAEMAAGSTCPRR
jgi:hypothetical protein